MVDLDGGPGFAEVRLARGVIGGKEVWLDDWSVVDGQLLRPGRDPVVLARAGVAVEVDELGRVVARARDGRRLEILRADDGSFVGMRAGTVSVRLDGDGAVASDGRKVRYVREDGRISSVTDPAGRRTRYVWSNGALGEIVWADGTRARLAVGQIDAGGRWSCTRDGARTRWVAPGGGTWLLDEDEEGRVLLDPAGARTRDLRVEGRLVGWIDPRGGRTEIADDGRTGSVEDPTGARWTWARDAGGIARLAGPMGATWVIQRDKSGAISQILDPAGRTTAWTHTTLGAPQRRTFGGGSWAWERDHDGRISTIRPPSGGEVRLGRDTAGRVVKVADGTGAAWTVLRDENGQVRVLTDAAGVAWALKRDALGRISMITEPSGRVVSLARRDDDRLSMITVGLDERWELLRSGSGALTGVRDPLGRLTGFDRDPIDRIRAVRRADGATFSVERDAAGDVVSVGGMRVRRDGVGRALSVGTTGAALVWTRDGAGRVVGVDGPGVSLVLGRGADGAIREVRVPGQPAVVIDRDQAGRLVRATGAVPVAVDRDVRGLVIALRREGAPILRLTRDLRGAVAQILIGEQTWSLLRDGAARILRSEGPDGLSLGVDRDPAGLPRLIRFGDGGMARISRSHEAVDLVVLDAGGAREGGAAWAWDVAGRLEQLRGAAEYRMRRDPLGLLIAAEAGARTWSWSAAAIQGPEGASIELDERGRPRKGRMPEGAPAAWGVASKEIGWVVDEDGAMREIAGGRGSVRLAHDGVGRLLTWTGPDGKVDVVWDALGRIARVGADAVEGWEGLMAWGAQRRVVIPGVAVARPGGGVFYGPDLRPVSTLHAGDLETAPGGLPFGPATGETAAGGRFAPLLGGPLLGLLDAVEPFSGQPTGGEARFPWSPPRWEAGASPSPWPDPDSSAQVPWDPAPWRPTSPWSEPLQLLAGIDVLPAGGPAGERAPGLPWLPASLASDWPQVLPDPLADVDEEEPEVAWVLQHALRGEAAGAEDLTTMILKKELSAEMLDLDGLFPDLAPGLR